MEAALKSSNINTEMQAALPPMVIDALVQTDSVAHEDEACQTEKSTGIECEVQANSERRSLCTQTIKVEADEIGMPNLPSSSSSKIVQNGEILESKTPSEKNSRAKSPTGAQESKKRKISSIETSRLQSVNLRTTREADDEILRYDFE